jgi:hypothetical protein
VTDADLLAVELPRAAWEAVADALDTYRHELEHSQRGVRKVLRIQEPSEQQHRLALVEQAALAVVQQAGVAER